MLLSCVAGIVGLPVKSIGGIAAGTVHAIDDAELDPSILQETEAAAGQSMLVTVICGTICLVCVLLLVYFVIRKRLNREKGETVFLASKSRAHYKKALLLYKTFDDFALTHRFLNRLRVQFAMIMPGDAQFAKMKALQTACIIWGISLVSVIIILLVKPTVYLVVCACITLYVLSTEIVSYIVEKNEIKVLTQLKRFISRVRYYYLTENMIDEAVYDAIADVPELMQAHAKQILDVLQAEADKQDEALFRYKNAVPNRFLKQFMAICLTTQLNGDKKVNKQSLCITNMKNLSTDIDIELRKKRDISVKFSGLSFVCIAPIYALMPLRQWAVSNMTGMQSFYYGSIGAMVQVACFVITMVCYTLLRRLRETYRAESGMHFILQELYSIRPIKHLVDNYWNRNYGRKLKFDRVLRQTGSKIFAEHFLIQQWIIMLLAYAVTIAVAIMANYETKKYTVENYSSIADASVSGTEAQYLIMMILSKYYFEEFRSSDQSLLDLYNEHADNSGIEHETKYTKNVQNWFNEMMNKRFLLTRDVLPEEDVIDLVHQYNKIYSASTKLATKIFGTTKFIERDSENKELSQAYKQLDDIIRRATEEDPLANTEGMYELIEKTVFNKLKSYEGAYFKWYYMLAALLAGIVGFKFPVWLLKFNAAELQVRMEDEVIQFQAIILLLIYFDDVNALTILEWMDMFADVFSSSISRCITSFTMDEDAALKRLEEDEPFEMFANLVENLQMVDNVGVLQAFNELEATRLSYQEKRAQENGFSVTRKASMASMIAMVPMIVVIGAYLIAPIMYFAFSSMNDLSAEMSTM